ncbi:DEAD/DEAH box helicase [Chitinasiproducens palmae]|nr:DEAD/DEAH box helicase [Chitinasiproducens palmae]
MSDNATHPSQTTPNAGSTESSAAAPIERFDAFGLSADILRAIAQQGYTTPTPIQAQSIPIVLAGRDLMGAAQTGTGKTASFSLPIIQRLLPHANRSVSPARHPVRALILTPTRELADQVAANVQSYAAHTGLRSAVVFGGVDIKPQAAELRGGVEILIATPGRLLDHIEQRNTQLSQVQMLVLDEADRMLDMGFLPDLQRILNLLPASRQTLLFSATFSNEIKRLAASYLRDPVTIEVARRNATATNVTQTIYEIDGSDREGALVQLMRERGLTQVIVFCNSKLGASRLARRLEREGIAAAAIHGDKSQLERMQALEAFKRGEVSTLVATDVAARGIDIADLPAVINYDLPFNAEDYVHRIGRTGRAGASGDALSLCAPDDKRLLADIEKLIGREIDKLPLVMERRSRAPRRDEYRGGEGRREWSDRGERGGRNGHAPSRARPAPVDDFFLRPYEAAPAKVEAAADAADAAGDQARKAPKRQLAALLGGGTPK